MSRYEQIRKASGLSREKAAAKANVTPTICRLFEEAGESAVKDERKRESPVRTYRELDQATAERSA